MYEGMCMWIFDSSISRFLIEKKSFLLEAFGFALTFSFFPENWLFWKLHKVSRTVAPAGDKEQGTCIDLNYSYGREIIAS